MHQKGVYPTVVYLAPCHLDHEDRRRELIYNAFATQLHYGHTLQKLWQPRRSSNFQFSSLCILKGVFFACQEGASIRERGGPTIWLLLGKRGYAAFATIRDRLRMFMLMQLNERSN